MSQLAAILLGTALAIIGYTIKAIRAARAASAVRTATDTAAPSSRVMTGASRRTGNHCRLSKRRERRLMFIAP